MYKRTQLIILLTVSFILSGCASSQKSSNSPILANSEMINIHQLAGRLAMTVTAIEKDQINIGDSDNQVVLYLDTDQVYVNNTYLAPLGRTKKIQGFLSVRADLEEEIRNILPSNEPEVVTTPIVLPPIPILPTNHNKWLIVVDAGHGGKDPGAIGLSGIHEKTINLIVASQIAELLKADGYRVITTRADDKFIELEERAAIANRNKANLFICIHSNSCPKSTQSGFSIYVSRSASNSSQKLASDIDEQMKKTSIKSNGTMQADFKVLVQTRCPAVLIELGYLSNFWDEKKLRDKNTQQALAEAIAAGITNYTDK